FSCSPQYQPKVARINDPPIHDCTLERLASYITHVKICINIDRSRFLNEISKICFLYSFMTRHTFQPFLN
ncbi:hypothetical protein BCV72DRAFT_188514, partial [Rhizopus microsporus var. microsporus]